MSEAKHSDSDFRLRQKALAATRTAPLGIADSQPRPTLEMTRAMALLEATSERGTDPYNAVGRRAR